MDMIRLNLDENVYLKCKGGREVVGKLHAYDEHCNMLLSNATQTVTPVDVDQNTEEAPKVTTQDKGTIFVRGDSLILLSHSDQK